MVINNPSADATSQESDGQAEGQQPSQEQALSIAPSQRGFARLASRFFGNRPVVEAEDGGDTEDGGQGKGEQSKVETDKADEGNKSPKKVELTEEELERRIQSETDRREAKRKQQEQARQSEERLAKLKVDDPDAYIAEQDQAKATGEFISNVARQYDATLLDPIKGKLPEQVQAELLGRDGVHGLEGRKEFLTKAVDYLVKQAREEGEREAEKKLRKNPAVLKQLLMGDREEEQEPDGVVAGTGAVAPRKPDMNAILRGAFGRR